MADSQVPWGLDALNGAVTEPAWKTKPSWYLVSTDDRMIPPDAQRAIRCGPQYRQSLLPWVSRQLAVPASIGERKITPQRCASFETHSISLSSSSAPV